MTRPRPVPAPPLRTSPPALPGTSACVGCGGRPTTGEPICRHCRKTLAHCCLGKRRLTQLVAEDIQFRHARAKAYRCPVCQEWHTGHESIPGRKNHADAALIVLKLRRSAPDYLEGLAYDWHPAVADRAEWRAALEAERVRRAQAPARGVKA